MDEESNKVNDDYILFPRRFISYRWFKPLLVLALGFVFMLVIQIALLLAAAAWEGNFDFVFSISTGYDDMNAYTGPGALFEIGGIAAMLPALALAILIVRDRPYSSYSSSRGGWNWRLFAKCLGIAAVVLGVSTIVDLLIPGHTEETFVNRFTVEGVILCLILVPIQCAAEEYVFRGFVMQTVGSWFKVPVIGVIVSAVLFAAGHPYNSIGVTLIFFNGIIWGAMAWLTKGLEATSAVHIVNNYLAFFLAGLGIQPTTSEVDIASLVVALAIDIVYALAVILIGRKFSWFESHCDGAASFNEKKRAKMEEKAARKQQARQSTQLQGQPLAQGGFQQPMLQAAQLPVQWQAQAPAQGGFQPSAQPAGQSPALWRAQPPALWQGRPPAQGLYAADYLQQSRDAGYPEPPLRR